MGEESDVNRKGEAMSHFEMYMEAMNSLEASTTGINTLMKQLDSGESIQEVLKNTTLPPSISSFLTLLLKWLRQNSRI